MKKLLSLLSVLTISGTAVPTIIAASPYQKKEQLLNSNINYLQINNLENLIRSKRSNTNIKLTVPSVEQKSQNYCGPAVSEVVIRYFGLNWETIHNNGGNTFSVYSSFQDWLDGWGRLWIVETPQHSWSDRFGTRPNDLLNSINSIINTYNLNNRRQYSITTINPPRTSQPIDSRNFFHLIRNSLENNVPVVLAYNGQPPNIRTGGADENHFIVITGITGNEQNPESVIYTYMNPADGLSNTFNGGNHDLTSLFLASQEVEGIPSYLLSYINPAQTGSLNINRTEPIECDYALGRKNITLMLQNSCSNENSRSIRFINNYNSTCLPISDENRECCI